MYLALKCKPNKGSKIQNLVNVALGIMLRLKVVKNATKEKAIAAATATGADDDDNAADEGRKGMMVLLELMEPWHHSNRLVTTNAYFASIEVALKVEKEGSFLLVMSSSAVGVGAVLIKI